MNKKPDVEINLPKSSDIKENKVFKILSVDGGGIRGIIPATLLCEVQSRLEKPVWHYFDLICGTSTGGLIALALSIEKTPQEIQNAYLELADQVFRPVRSMFQGFRKWYDVVYGIGAAYNTKNLENLLKEFLNGSQNSFKMKDAKVRLCIPTIDITNGKVRLYKTPHSVVYPKEETFFIDSEREMWEVARATSAAPIYFSPICVNNSYHVDGGMWANNPSLVGFIEGMRTGFPPGNISILSLGTGETTFQVEQSRAKRMNLKNWGMNGLIELSFQSQSQAVHNQIASLSVKTYIRAQHKFQNNIPLDDISRINDLKAAGHNIFQEKGNDIMNLFFDRTTSNPPYNSLQIKENA